MFLSSLLVQHKQGSMINRAYYLVLAQLLFTLFLSQPTVSQLESEDRSNSFDEVSRDHFLSNSDEDDVDEGDEYPDGTRTRGNAPIRGMDHRMRRAWGKNSMNVWGKRNQMNKLGRLDGRNIDAIAERLDHGNLSDENGLPLVKSSTNRNQFPDARDLKVTKRGGTPKHRDNRWFEYNYLRRAKMAPQWGRNNMHVWG